MKMQKFGIVILFCYMIMAEGERHKIALDPMLNPELLKGPLQRKVKINDYMDLTCPQYDIDDPETERVQFNLYNLSYEAYQSCKIEDGAKIFACDAPTKTKKLTTKFQRLSPSPLGFTFRDGQSYYYVGGLEIIEMNDANTTNGNYAGTIPLHQKEPNCEKAMRLIISVEKHHHHHISKTVKPPIRSLPTTSTTTTTKSTTTIASTTILRTSKLIKAVSAGSRVTKTTGGNGATSVHITFVTTLLSLIILLHHL